MQFVPQSHARVVAGVQYPALARNAYGVNVSICAVVRVVIDCRGARGGAARARVAARARRRRVVRREGMVCLGVSVCAVYMADSGQRVVWGRGEGVRCKTRGAECKRGRDGVESSSELGGRGVFIGAGTGRGALEGREEAGHALVDPSGTPRSSQQ